MRAKFTPTANIPTHDTHESSGSPKKPSSRSLTIEISLTSKKLIIGLLVGILSVSLVVYGLFMVRTNKPTDVYSSLPGTAAGQAQLSEKEVKALVMKVGKHLILPEGTPQIVAIANVDQLKVDQPFFRTAANGDQLLVYPNKVILYRPGTDQIVDVAAIRANLTSTPSMTPKSPTSISPTGVR